MMRRRSTKAELLLREQQQAAIIAELMLLGADDIATKVIRCWRDRLCGDPQQHRYRCRTCSCLSCRRPPLAAWWRSFSSWSKAGGATSYARLPLGDPLVEAPLIAKGLRNLRDRAAQESWLFEDLAFCGVTDGQHLHVLVSHPSLIREQVQRRLRALWPEMVLADVPTAPVFKLSAQMLALLGSMRRGVQPARFIVLPRHSR